MKNNFPAFRLLSLTIAVQAALCASAWAADFTVTTGSTDTSGKTITTGNTGTVAAGGTLGTSGTTQAITVTGTTGTVTLNNSGTIQQTGTARAIRNNTSGVTFIINNAIGASITSAADDVVKVTTTSIVRIDNQGTIWAKGTGPATGQALDLRDPAGGFVINGSTTNSAAIIRSDGDDAMRPSANMTITNYGTIISNGIVNTKCPDYLGALCTGAVSASDAIDIGGNAGVVIENFGTISGPRHGITVDNAVTVTNQLGGQITGRNGSGVGSDGTATVINYGTISGQYVGAGLAYDHLGNRLTYTDPMQTTVNNGDGDGVDIDGIGTVTNYGRIEGLGGGGYDSGGRPNGGDGLALGGGTVTNAAGAVIWGKSNGILVDDGANGTDANNLVGNRNRGTAALNGAAGTITITNSGEITGDRKAAIGLVGDWNDTITNNTTGVITGGLDTQQVDKLSTDPTQSAGAAIQMGAGNDTLTNYGKIEGKNGLAVDMGTGDDAVKLFAGGNTGIVIGTVNGGAGDDTLETGGAQTFSQGTILNFERFIVRDGTTTFNYGLGNVTQIQVDAGATLQINGAVSTTGNLTVNGTFKAPTGSDTRTITVAGNYSQGAAGVLEARVGPSGSDRITVTGTATLANGATIRPVASGYIANGTTFRLISAGTLNATPASLVVDRGSNFLTYQLQAVNNELVLVAQRTNNFATVTTAGKSGVATGLEGFLTSGAPNTATLLSALEALPDAAALGLATSRLAPETNGANRAAAGASQGSLFSAFSSRMDGVRSGGPIAMSKSGLSAGDAAGNRFWMEGLGSSATQNARNGSDGYKLDAQGAGFGYEKDLNVSDMIGLALGYTQAGSKGSDNSTGNDNKLEAIHLGGYFSRTLPGYTLDLGVAYSVNHNSTSRLVTLPGFTESLQGSFGGQQIGAQMEYGLPFAINSVWSGRWLMGARLGQLRNDGYSETGGATAQRVDAQKSNTTQSVLGAEVTHKLSPSSSYTLRGRYLHEFSDTPITYAAFANGGPGFTVQDTQPARDSLQLGVGYRKVTSQGTTISFNYNAEIKDKFVGHQLSARAMWTF